MSWRDLLAQNASQQRTFLWLEGCKVRDPHGQAWGIERGHFPPGPGWHIFTTQGRKAFWVGRGEPRSDLETLAPKHSGYMVGNDIIFDDSPVIASPEMVPLHTHRVHLVEPGLERFTRAVVWQHFSEWVFLRVEFPLGPETEATIAFQDRVESWEAKGALPSLRSAFFVETYYRALAEEEGRQQEALRQAARARAEREARTQRALRDAGTALGRRQLAALDFPAAARAALQVSDAELLDTRDLGNGQMVVQYRFRQRRLECVVDRDTLRVVDAGVCLTDESTGETGDTRFTLESLPAVIAEAMDEGHLVVWRHAPGDRY
jgi:hypothetical protein